jgi:ParB/RepB/Spo0J family partition protein
MTDHVLDRPALEQPTVERPSIQGSHFLPLNLCAPSPFNPRKRFNQARLEDLANSIEKVGVLQPALMRPKPDAKRGGPQYEIVAGERRWRACQILAKRLKQQDVAVIPAIVRDISDFEALEMAAVENVQREDVHPIEEAEGYEALLLKPLHGGEFHPARMRGYSVAEIAARVGKSPSYVFGRLNLCKLIPAAREACYEDKLTTRVAQLISRVPADLQPAALEDIMRGWGGEPYSYRQACEHLQKNYMLALGRAVFLTSDAQLLPSAGSCNECPKRTGANPDLFNDVKSADTCTDPKCFDAKTEAHGQQLLEQGRAAGVLTGEAAKKVMPYGQQSLSTTGHIDIDKPWEGYTGNKKKLRTLLGDDFDGAILVMTEDMELPITVAKLDKVKAVLKSKGLLKPSTKPGVGQPIRAKTAESIQATRERRTEDMLHSRLPAALAKHIDNGGLIPELPSSPNWLLLLAKALYERSDVDIAAVQVAVCGSAQTSGWIKELDGERLEHLVVQLMFCGAVADEASNYPDFTLPGQSDDMAADIGFDLAALRAEVADEVDAAIRDELAELQGGTGASASTAKKAKPHNKKAPAAEQRELDVKSSNETPLDALAKAEAKALKDWPFPGHKDGR